MMGSRKEKKYLQSRGQSPPTSRMAWGNLQPPTSSESATSQPGLCLACLSLEKSIEPARDLYFRLSRYMNLMRGKHSTVKNPLLCLKGNFFLGFWSGLSQDPDRQIRLARIPLPHTLLPPHLGQACYQVTPFYRLGAINLG